MIDIRLKENFFDHPKTRRLCRKLGDDARICLLRLWCWVAENRPEGLLYDLDPEDLAFHSGWRGEASVLLQALVDDQWLHETDNGLEVHEWGQHQSWACRARERSEQARAAARARWASRYPKISDQETEPALGNNSPEIKRLLESVNIANRRT